MPDGNWSGGTGNVAGLVVIAVWQEEWVHGSPRIRVSG